MKRENKREIYNGPKTSRDTANKVIYEKIRDDWNEKNRLIEGCFATVYKARRKIPKAQSINSNMKMTTRKRE